VVALDQADLAGALTPLDKRVIGTRKAWIGRVIGLALK